MGEEVARSPATAVQESFDNSRGEKDAHIRWGSTFPLSIPLHVALVTCNKN